MSVQHESAGSSSFKPSLGPLRIFCGFGLFPDNNPPNTKICSVRVERGLRRTHDACRNICMHCLSWRPASTPTQVPIKGIGTCPCMSVASSVQHDKKCPYTAENIAQWYTTERTNFGLIKKMTAGAGAGAGATRSHTILFGAGAGAGATKS